MAFQLLNIFFFVFHTIFMIFNCTGWAWKKTRRWNLYTLLLTAASWFLLGIWFGWGYCACTDWHWDVREKLGYFDQSRSYVHFLLLKLTGIDFNKKLVEQTTLIVFLVSLAISLFLNYRDYRRKTFVSKSP